MEILVWLFVGLMLFFAAVVLFNFLSGERHSAVRLHNIRWRIERERRLHREFWARAEAEDTRLRARAIPVEQSPADGRPPDCK